MCNKLISGLIPSSSLTPKRVLQTEKVKVRVEKVKAMFGKVIVRVEKVKMISELIPSNSLTPKRVLRVKVKQ